MNVPSHRCAPTPSLQCFVLLANQNVHPRLPTVRASYQDPLAGIQEIAAQFGFKAPATIEDYLNNGLSSADVEVHKIKIAIHTMHLSLLCA